MAKTSRDYMDLTDSSQQKSLFEEAVKGTINVQKEEEEERERAEAD